MRIRDKQRETQVIQSRLIISMVLVGLAFVLLSSRMVWLQWLQHDRFSALADQNRIHSQEISPPPGLIRDRPGKILANNQPDFSLVLVPEQTPDLEHTLDSISALISFDEEQRTTFHTQRQNRRRPWEPIPVRNRLSPEEIARLVEIRHEHPGLQIRAEAIRHYPYADLLSHVVGYVNRLNADDIARMDEATLSNYSGTHFYGRSGIERQYEHLLHGQVGYRQVETNARGRVLRELSITPPVPGQDVQLYLDLDVQQAAREALAGWRGAIVAIDPRNGGILAFVSEPGYDPNLFVTGISVRDYSAYRDSPDRPLFNRAIQGQYPPGSTIKPIIGLAALQNGSTDWDYTINDTGIFYLPGSNRPIRDWKRGGHGRVSLDKAIVESCDTYFYDVSLKMGIDQMSQVMRFFGFGQKTGIDLPNETSGIMPDRDWKRATGRGGWFHGATVNASIGQGYMLATPLQLAHSTAMIANRGKTLIPRVRAGENLPNGERFDSDREHFQRMTQAMEEVIHGRHGTARGISRNLPYRIAGKTGTAQVFSVAADVEYKDLDVQERLRDHALFVGYAPADNPSIAVAVLVENGEGGSRVAAPMGRKLMDTWLLDAQGNLKTPPAEVSKP